MNKYEDSPLKALLNSPLKLPVQQYPQQFPPIAISGPQDAINSIKIQ